MVLMELNFILRFVLPEIRYPTYRKWKSNRADTLLVKLRISQTYIANGKKRRVSPFSPLFLNLGTLH